MSRGYFASFDELHAMADYLLENCSEDEAVERVREMLIEAYIKGRKKTCSDLGWDWSDYYLLGWDEWEQEVICKDIAGQTFEERIRKHYRDFNAEGIAKVIDTEYHRDFETGGFDQAEDIQQEANRIVYKVWNTMMDDRVRETHDYIGGEKVPLASRFYTFDGDSAAYPGGFSLPENNIGCRCWLTYGW